MPDYPRVTWLTPALNLMIAAGSVATLTALVVLLLRGRNRPYKRIVALYAGNIGTFGALHLFGAIFAFFPATWLSNCSSVLAILLCLAGTIVVWPVIRSVFAAERDQQAADATADSDRRQLEELALTDSLTGLANRRQFDAFLQIECRRARRTGSPLALIMFDVDQFKPFNDAYGHPGGDSCLRAIAGAASHQLRRAGDLAARLAGDEFAVILPGTDDEGAVLIAERILEAVRAIGLLHPGSSSGMVTVSAGVASIQGPTPDDGGPSHLIERADVALYLAKGGGGNKVCPAGRSANADPSSWALAKTSVCGDNGSSAERLHAEAARQLTPRMPAGLDFATILRALPLGVVLTDSTQVDDPIIFANAGFAAMTGYSLKEILGRNSRFLQGGGTDPRTVAEIADAMRRGVPIRRELLHYRKSGETFWNELITQPLVDPQGAVVGFIGLQIEQAAKHHADDAEQDETTKLAELVENLPGYLFQRILTPQGSVIYSFFSRSYWRLLGVNAVPPLSGVDPYAYIHPADIAMVRAAVARSLATVTPATIEHRVMRADDTILWLRTHSTPRKMADGNVVWDGIGIDVTAEMASREGLAYLAYHDPLTGLGNRVPFLRTVEAICARSLSEDRRIGVFSIDLRAFQEINDRLGSTIGDTVLRSIAARLSEFAGAAGVAARLGGDEFGVAICDVLPQTPIVDKAAALSQLLQRPIKVSEHEITIQAHIGGTLYPISAGDEPVAGHVAEELLKQSDFALAEAKRAGGGVFRIYSKDLDDREKNRAVLRHSMRLALHEQQFVLHYHPIVDLATGQILGAEALVRWSHPELGMQRPDLFIPEAESSGLIVPLGAWVLRTALFELREWQNRSTRPLRISVNVSGIQLRDPGFLPMLNDLLEETGVDPRLIDLELTESVLIDGSTLRVLHTLKQRGYRLSIDDFGTGYSSFRYLQTLPIEQVKIDQTFVRHMVIDSSDASIVRAIVSVARSLNLEIVAEGIEQSAQWEFLRNEGCRIGQGYFFSLPLTAEDFRWLLSNNTTLPLGVSCRPFPILDHNERPTALVTPHSDVGLRKI